MYEGNYIKFLCERGKVVELGERHEGRREGEKERPLIFFPQATGLPPSI